MKRPYRPEFRTIKKKDREQVYEKYNGHCAYCGKEIMYKEMQVDHAIPLDRIPYHKEDYPEEVYTALVEKINSINNLMPSCRMCNHYKRSADVEEYRKSLLTLHERLQKIYIYRVACDYGVTQLIPFDGVFYFEKYEK